MTAISGSVVELITIGQGRITSVMPASSVFFFDDTHVLDDNSLDDFPAAHQHFFYN